MPVKSRDWRIVESVENVDKKRSDYYGKQEKKLKIQEKREKSVKR